MTHSDVCHLIVVDAPYSAPTSPTFMPHSSASNIQTGSSPARRHTFKLVTLQRAERHQWGWDIPASRCPESIGLICPDPLPGCPATTAFEGVQHFWGLRSLVWVFPLGFFSALFTRLLVDLQFDRSSSGDRPVSSAGDQVGGPTFR